MIGRRATDCQAADGDDLLSPGAARVVVHREVGALTAEGERDRAAEAAAGAGHQGYASVQSSHAGVLMIAFAA
jgi:hypothetical protein